MNEVNMDWERTRRTGLGEAVLCPGKSLAQLRTILLEAERRGSAVLFTRISSTQFTQLGIENGSLEFDSAARTATYRPEGHEASVRRGKVAVITAGSADIPVAKEAVQTLRFHGLAPIEAYDCGVAGLWRLEAQLPRLREQEVIICVAGMDAALPTVLAGLVPALVIAVPTSTGYGMAKGGETALNALLCSCAQGLTVVNIDNGFGAACAALRALHSRDRRAQSNLIRQDGG